MHKILIVEDDQYFREALRDLLKKKFVVLEAPNGKSAKDILTMQDVDVVLSDIQMPGLTGIELLEWSLTNKPVPFVIMTGFSMVLETKSAFDLGAKGFIAKPFKNSELFAVLDSILAPPEKDKFPVVEAAKNYCKVPIDEFVSRSRIEFDVFIKLAENKVIRIAHKGEEIPADKLSHYKQKGLKYLYIQNEDFSKLVDFNLDVVKLMKDRSDISEQKKVNFLKYTGELILEKSFVEGIDKESFQDAKSFLEMTMAAVTQSSDTLDLLSLINSHSDHTYGHSLGVSMYSVLIAKKMGIESNTSLFKLAVAGLFHDIGKKEIDRAILEKPRHLTTREEQAIIESHVPRGHGVLSVMPNIHSEVLQMVFEHHEDQEGLGYPFRKKKFEQHPFSKIIQAANIFVDTAMVGPNNAGESAAKAISHIEKIYDKRVDSQCLKALKEIFKVV